MHSIGISSSDSFLEVLEKVAMVMRRHNKSVEIGYEAPWSAKIGAKKVLSYITNESELKEFWLAYNQCIRNLNSKKHK